MFDVCHSRHLNQGALEAAGKLELQCNPSGERGLFAAAPIQAGDLLLVVPLSLALTDCDTQPTDSMSDAFWGLRLAARLLQERAKGASSLWAPYLATLPASVPAPLQTFSWEAIKAVEVPSVVAAIHKWHWTATTCGDGHPPAVFGGGEDLLPWAMAVRCFRWVCWLCVVCSLCGCCTHEKRSTACNACRNICSICFTPHIYIHTTVHKTFVHTLCPFIFLQVVHSRTFGNAGPNGAVAVHMLVPIVDLLNHSGARYRPTAVDRVDRVDNVAWNIVGPSRAMTGGWELQLAATSDVRRGEELLLSYGDRDNDDFLVHYGQLLCECMGVGVHPVGQCSQSSIQSVMWLLFVPTLWAVFAAFPLLTMLVGQCTMYCMCWFAIVTIPFFSGFVPPRNPHDSVVLFQDIEEAAEWFAQHRAVLFEV